MMKFFQVLKAAYGLLNDPKEWLKKLEQTLKDLGWVQTKLDTCFWKLYDENGVLVGLCGVHVDDLLSRFPWPP